jgi:hypothetical protein
MSIFDPRPTLLLSEYPATFLFRIRLALCIFASGWALWWISMFIVDQPAGPSTGPTLFGPPGHMARAEILFAAFGAVSLPFNLFMPNTQSPVSLAPQWAAFAYCVSLLSAWCPVVLRATPVLLWPWRLICLSLILVPSLEGLRYDQFTGISCLLLSFGSLLIAVSVWITPPRLFGEPDSAWAVLRRAKKCQPILTLPAYATRHAFPEIDTP